ncbi:hypothetical protein VP01_1496g6 [Puccinia sorghi]|uniref:Integrase catalytic domain-containing protein n=1 Tax=Puccinia sorghi TaxID=27349 RepID=A0A0L6VL07_9BASI|nr:hypothetical protein VP01_1496g6 [Puccinia sorghi]
MDLFISLDSTEEGCVKTSSGNDLLSIKGIGRIKLSFLLASEELHKSLGHVSYTRLRQKLGVPLKNITQCEAFALGNIKKASFKSKHQTALRPFEELHLDLIGPISPTSREGERYILTVVESNTRYYSANPINLKSDVYNTLSNILNIEATRRIFSNVVPLTRPFLKTQKSADNTGATWSNLSKERLSLSIYSILSAILSLFSMNLKHQAQNSTPKDKKRANCGDKECAVLGLSTSQNFSNRRRRQ